MALGRAQNLLPACTSRREQSSSQPQASLVQLIIVIMPTVPNLLTEPTVSNGILDLLLQIGAIVLARSQQ
jgi:hypothetical protein